MNVVTPCFDPDPLEPEPADGLWFPDDLGALAPPKNGSFVPPDCPTDGLGGAFEPEGAGFAVTGDFLPAKGGAVTVEPPPLELPPLTDGVGITDRPGVEIVGPPLLPGVPVGDPPDTGVFGVAGSLNPLGRPEPDDEPAGGLIVALPGPDGDGLTVAGFGGEDGRGLTMLGLAEEPLLGAGARKPERPELLDEPGLKYRPG